MVRPVKAQTDHVVGKVKEHGPCGCSGSLGKNGKGRGGHGGKQGAVEDDGKRQRSCLGQLSSMEQEACGKQEEEENQMPAGERRGGQQGGKETDVSEGKHPHSGEKMKLKEHIRRRAEKSARRDPHTDGILKTAGKTTEKGLSQGYAGGSRLESERPFFFVFPVPEIDRSPERRKQGADYGKRRASHISPDTSCTFLPKRPGSRRRRCRGPYARRWRSRPRRS